MSSTLSTNSAQLWQPWLPKIDEAQSFLKCKGLTAGSKRELHHVIYHPEPIDMSITKRIRGSLPSYQQSIQSKQAAAAVANRRPPNRPSVITSCVVNNNNDISSTSSTGSSSNANDLLDDDGVCDSVVNEHFRRSLGRNYREYFPSGGSKNNFTGSSGNSSDIEEDTGSGLSVDDHFAKALGEDTWLRLQQRKKQRSDESSPTASTAASTNRGRDEQDIVTTSAPVCRASVNSPSATMASVEERNMQKLLLRHHRMSQ